MCRRLASSVKYVGAATVEFLYIIEEGNYYFLELNPRLQVEHPVTEWISGVNIPAAQVMIGMGIPLSAMPEIRAMYGLDPAGTSAIDFDTAPQVRLPTEFALARASMGWGPFRDDTRGHAAIARVIGGADSSIRPPSCSSVQLQST